jgi:hypothetical protein
LTTGDPSDYSGLVYEGFIVCPENIPLSAFGSRLGKAPPERRSGISVRRRSPFQTLRYFPGDACFRPFDQESYDLLASLDLMSPRKRVNIFDE